MTFDELITRHHKIKNKYAFTLAEILISVAVVGVVAMLTVPAILSKKDRREWISGLNKANTTLSNGFKSAETEHGKILSWNENVFFKNFVSNLNVLKTCSNNDCVPDEKYLNGENAQILENSNSYILSDGQIITVNLSNIECKLSVGNLKGICGTVYVDVNGSKSPNTWAKDYFGFYVTTSGIYPFGTSKTDVVKEGFKWTSNGCTNGEAVCAEGKTVSCANANTNQTICETCRGDWRVYNKEAYSTPVYALKSETYQVSSYIPSAYTITSYASLGYIPNSYSLEYDISGMRCPVGDGYTNVIPCSMNVSNGNIEMFAVCNTKNNSCSVNYRITVNGQVIIDETPCICESRKVSSIASYASAGYQPTGYSVSTYTAVTSIATYSHNYISTYTYYPAKHETSCLGVPESVCLGYKYTQQYDCWYNPDGYPFQNDCNKKGKASETSCNLEFKNNNALQDCSLSDKGTSCAAWVIVNGNMIYLDNKQVYW